MTENFGSRASKAISTGLSKILKPDSARQFKVVDQWVFIPNLPTAFESLKIVQISDIHYYEYSNSLYDQVVVETINRLKPDMIVATGDIIHYGSKYLGLAEFFLKQLQAPMGKWACMGNHDYSDGYQGFALRKMMKASGFRVLVNHALPVEKEGEKIWISGIDDLRNGTPEFDAIIGRVDATVPHIALAHNPLLAPHLSKIPTAPQLILSGHTHGGHVNHPLINLFQRHVFQHRYQYGWFTFLEKSQLYVTSGIGSASIALHFPNCDFALHPFRYQSTPEIAVFNLTGQPKQVIPIEQQQTQQNEHCPTVGV